MTPTLAWAILQGPLLNFALGIALAVGGIALLSEYRRLFMEDPRTVMSVEVLMAIISRSGGPGYFAAFLFTGALLNFAFAIYSFIFNVSRFVNL